jgi:hypothetical protein
MNFKKPQRMVPVLALAGGLWLAGCSTSNRLISQWSNPGYAAPSFQRVMIGSSGGETAIRRNLEDEFVAQLKGAGIDALPSYRSILDDQKIDEARIQDAAKRAGADAVIIARSVGIEQETEYRPHYYPYPAFGFFGPRFGMSWSVLYGAPSVRRYDVYTSEVTLVDVAKNEVVWTGTVKTTETDDVAAATRDYVQTVVKALQEKNLLRGPKRP